MIVDPRLALDALKQQVEKYEIPFHLIRIDVDRFADPRSRPGRGGYEIRKNRSKNTICTLHPMVKL